MTVTSLMASPDGKALIVAVVATAVVCELICLSIAIILTE